MERKAIIIENKDLKQLNKMLSEGWEVEHISAFAQGVTTGQSYGVITGPYGAYVILKRKLTESEIKAKLAAKGIMEDNIWE